MIRKAQLQGLYTLPTERVPTGIALHWLHPNPFGKDLRTDQLSASDRLAYSQRAKELLRSSPMSIGTGGDGKKLSTSAFSGGIKLNEADLILKEEVRRRDARRAPTRDAGAPRDVTVRSPPPPARARPRPRAPPLRSAAVVEREPSPPAATQQGPRGCAVAECARPQIDKARCGSRAGAGQPVDWATCSDARMRCCAPRQQRRASSMKPSRAQSDDVCSRAGPRGERTSAWRLSVLVICRIPYRGALPGA
jgi:hypothetical protein